jgi:hypothetical protein
MDGVYIEVAMCCGKEREKNFYGDEKSRNFALHLHATLIRLLSSSAPFENHGFDDLHVSSAPSFSADTRSVRMLDVKFASMPSLFDVTSACRMASPSSSHVTFAGGYEPHVSQRIGVGRPAVRSSLAVTIFTLIGFTEKNNNKQRLMDNGA